MTDAGNELQTDGAAHRKERFAKSVRANGRMSSGVAVERSVRALTSYHYGPFWAREIWLVVLYKLCCLVLFSVVIFTYCLMLF